MENNNVSKNNKLIIKNLLYNIVYQVINVLAPFLTASYIAKTLLADGVGKYSFMNSIVSVFILLIGLDITTYASREIAKAKNKYEQSKVFFEILVIKYFLLIIGIIVYIACCLLKVFGTYNEYMYYFIILLIAQFFEITFLYQGQENFKIISLRNIFIKIINIVLIFVIVKTKDDLVLYIILNTTISLLGGLLLCVNTKRNLVKVNLRKLEISKHIKPLLKLSLPTLIFFLYTTFNKILIGVLIKGDVLTETINIVNGVEVKELVNIKISDLENGYYEQADKIIALILAFISSLNIVMISRNSNELGKDNNDTVKNNIYFCSRLVFFFGLPVMFGLIAISRSFVLAFFGDSYYKTITILQIFAPLVIIIGICNIVGMQLLIPLGKNKQYTIPIIVGAIVSLLLNIFVIPRYLSIGTAFVRVFTELIVCILMIVFSRQYYSIKKLLLISIKYLIASLVMFIVVFATQYFLEPTLLSCVVIALEGCCVYFILLLILKEEIIMGVLKKIFKKKQIA